VLALNRNRGQCYAAKNPENLVVGSCLRARMTAADAEEEL
jgi:hypothetical protein